MPQHIQYIDKICRDKQRDVLYLTFDKQVFPNPDWSSWQSRKDIIHWLQQNNIGHSPCGDVASEHVFSSYKGQIYIDVPYDENDSNFLKLSKYLEHPDGSCKIEGVNFCYLPFEHAMKNQHHDEPGFWERLMEEF
jgi:hypothetical protein